MLQREQFFIAMIDDDNDEAEFIEVAINESGLPLHLCYFSTFDKFLEISSQSFLPDLVIMDINLPCKDGITCIQELKKDPKLSFIPVVTFSNTHSVKHEEDSVKAGAIELFVKPTSISEYQQVVQKFYNICVTSSASEFTEQAVA